MQYYCVIMTRSIFHEIYADQDPLSRSLPSVTCMAAKPFTLSIAGHITNIRSPPPSSSSRICFLSLRLSLSFLLLILTISHMLLACNLQCELLSVKLLADVKLKSPRRRLFSIKYKTSIVLFYLFRD